MDVLTTCSAGLEENSWSLPIYFDPIQTQLIVTNPDNLSGYNVGIYNEMRQLLKEQAVELNVQTTIPVTKLAAGIYFAKIYNAKKQQAVKFRML
jgi:bifunctional DNase/RNase